MRRFPILLIALAVPSLAFAQGNTATYEGQTFSGQIGTAQPRLHLYDRNSPAEPQVPKIYAMWKAESDPGRRAWIGRELVDAIMHEVELPHNDIADEVARDGLPIRSISLPSADEIALTPLRTLAGVHVNDDTWTASPSFRRITGDRVEVRTKGDGLLFNEHGHLINHFKTSADDDAKDATIRIDSDDGNLVLTRLEPSHGPGAGWPEYSVTPGGWTRVIRAGDAHFGFWPRSHALFFEAEGNELFSPHRIWFFDDAGRYSEQIAGSYLGVSDNKYGLLVIIPGGIVATLMSGPRGPAPTQVRGFTWPDGSRAVPLALYDDLHLGFFLRGSDLDDSDAQTATRARAAADIVVAKWQP